MILRLPLCIQQTMYVLPFVVACSQLPKHAAAPPAPPPAPLLPAVSSDDWRSQQPSVGSRGHLQMPTPDTYKLDNGATVYCMVRPSGPVSMSIVVNRGAEDVVPGKSGEAALTARLLVESTKHRNAFDLAKAAEMLGSTLSSSAQRDYVAVSLDTLPSDAERGIELLAEVIREPSWSNQDYSRVRDQWLDDLQAERQSPASLASLVAIRALFGTHRGAPVNGGITDVKSLTLVDLKSWYKGFVVPANVALIVVGPVDSQSTLATAKRVLGTWRAGPSIPSNVQYAAANQDSHRVVLVDRKGAVQSALFVAQPFPRRLEPGHEARLVLNDVLGGLFTSRINMNLREQHAYTYGAHSTIVANRNFGLFTVQTSVRTDATAPALAELLSELDGVTSSPVQKPLSDTELTRARADLRYRLGAHLEYNQFLVADVESIFSEGLETNYLSIAPETYTRSTLQDVQSQAHRLTPRLFTIVIVGDRVSVEGPLKQAGFSVIEPESTWTD